MEHGETLGLVFNLSENLIEISNSNKGVLGEKRKCYLYVMPPSNRCQKFNMQLSMLAFQHSKFASNDYNCSSLAYLKKNRSLDPL